jgi:hypothetical protein
VDRQVIRQVHLMVPAARNPQPRIRDLSGHIGLPDRSRMELRCAIRRLPLAGATVAGAAVGHSIAYLIVAPQGRSRAVLLAGTGHGYRSTFAAAELILGLLAIATFVARRFDRGLHRRRRPASAEPWAWVAVRASSRSASSRSRSCWSASWSAAR